MPFKYATPLARILANSRMTRAKAFDGRPCMLWTGHTTTSRNGAPYGRIGVRWKRGPRKGRGRSMLAHRYVVVYAKRRRLTTRSRVRHLCNNSLCVNPYHLVGGTRKSNVRQCVREGRHKTPWRREGGERYAAAQAK